VELAEKENLAIILSSHIIEELSRICHTLVVIKDGKIVNAGPSQQIIGENTDTYAICANNLATSNSIKKYSPVFKGQSAQVTIAPDRVSELIQDLHAENIFFTSCTPEINMEKLFETNAL
jgi:ABC-2 type transport system ATP-binding protein